MTHSPSAAADGAPELAERPVEGLVEGSERPGEIYAEVGHIYDKPAMPKLYVVMRDEAWRKYCRAHELYSDVTLGKALGFSPTTVWRIRTRQARPGMAFTLQAMRTFGAGFDELFEIAEEPLGGLGELDGIDVEGAELDGTEAGAQSAADVAA